MPHVSHSTCFGLYSRYYDLLYKDKNYSAEIDFVLKHLGAVPNLFELGCGTGKHAIELAKRNVEVSGIDLSPTMVEMAQAWLKLEPNNIQNKIDFQVGDARTHQFGQTFHSGTSLFHVASYQTKGADFEAYLKTAYKHLDIGGKFLYDFWYGPAVMAIQPEKKVKTLEDEKIKIVRTATPKVDAQRKTVTVHFSMDIFDIREGKKYEFEEDHLMRYFFDSELEEFPGKVGFRVITMGEWMTDEPLSKKSWGGFSILQKV